MIYRVHSACGRDLEAGELVYSFGHNAKGEILVAPYRDGRVDPHELDCPKPPDQERAQKDGQDQLGPKD